MGDVILMFILCSLLQFGTLFLICDVGKMVVLQILMGRPIRLARSKQFVKRPVEEGARSEDTSSEMSVNGVEADKAD